MRNGTVAAAGPLGVLQSDPTLPLAVTREAAVNFAGTVEAYDAAYGILTLRVKGGRLLVPAAAAEIGSDRRLRIAAGDVSLAATAPQNSTILNALPARIVSHTAAGAHEMIVVLGLGSDGGGERILSRITRRSWERLGLADGKMVSAQVKGVSLAHK
jgi:molybdate transport system ATP-binding protein